MEIERALAFVEQNHHAVLATTRADGSPQLSPVVVAVGEDSALEISTRESAMKTKNLLARPSASVVVLGDSFFGEWVQLDGRARVVHLPQAMEGLVAYYRRVSGEHPDWEEYRNAMTEQRRVLVRITVERAGPDRSG